MEHFSFLRENMAVDRFFSIFCDGQFSLDQTELTILATCKEILELFDRQLLVHSTNVAAYALKLAQVLGLEERKSIAISGFVHDIGKLYISKDLLNKPDKLKYSEYALLKTHSARGAGFIEKVFPHRVDLVEIVRHHHERYDGTGYPDQLAREEIPVGARIIGLVDTYDALTSTRTYRPKLSPAAALEEIDKNSGTQFDPHMVRVFIKEVLRG